MAIQRKTHVATHRPQGGTITPAKTTPQDGAKAPAAKSAGANTHVENKSADIDLDHQADVAHKLGDTSSRKSADAAGAQQTFAGPTQNAGGGGAAGLLRFSMRDAELQPGAKGPPTASVTAFMEEYGIGERLGRPRERILSRMAEVHEKLGDLTSTDDVATKLEEGMVRFSVFKLEGALKLYRKEYGDPIEDEYSAVKALEDKAGEVARYNDRIESAETLGLPQAAIDVLKSKRADAKVSVRKEIEENWVPDDNGQIPALANMADTLSEIDWDGYKGDRKTVLKELKRRAKKATKEFDIDELQGEEGLHELRRQLRWGLLYCGAMDGLVKLDPKDHPIPEFAPLINSDVAATKYAVLPSSAHEDKPLEISQSVFVALNRYVIDIGDIKDQRERVEDFAYALVDAGEYSSFDAAEHEAERLVLGGPEGAQKLDATIKGILKELAKHEPLEAFLDAF